MDYQEANNQNGLPISNCGGDGLGFFKRGGSTSIESFGDGGGMYMRDKFRNAYHYYTPDKKFKTEVNFDGGSTPGDAIIKIAVGNCKTKRKKIIFRSVECNDHGFVDSERFFDGLPELNSQYIRPMWPEEIPFDCPT